MPRLVDSSVSHSNERHRGQVGVGGCRRVSQAEQRWISSRPSAAPSKKNALSWVTISGGTDVLMRNLRA